MISCSLEEEDGFLIFNRNDSGDVKPKAILRGPRNAGLGAPYVYAEGGLLFASVKPRESEGAEMPKASGM